MTPLSNSVLPEGNSVRNSTSESPRPKEEYDPMAAALSPSAVPLLDSSPGAPSSGSSSAETDHGPSCNCKACSVRAERTSLSSDSLIRTARAALEAEATGNSKIKSEPESEHGSPGRMDKQFRQIREHRARSLGSQSPASDGEPSHENSIDPMGGRLARVLNTRHEERNLSRVYFRAAQSNLGVKPAAPVAAAAAAVSTTQGASSADPSFPKNHARPSAPKSPPYSPSQSPPRVKIEQDDDADNEEETPSGRRQSLLKRKRAASPSPSHKQEIRQRQLANNATLLPSSNSQAHGLPVVENEYESVSEDESASPSPVPMASIPWYRCSSSPPDHIEPTAFPTAAEEQREQQAEESEEECGRQGRRASLKRKREISASASPDGKADIRRRQLRNNLACEDAAAAVSAAESVPRDLVGRVASLSPLADYGEYERQEIAETAAGVPQDLPRRVAPLSPLPDYEEYEQQEAPEAALATTARAAGSLPSPARAAPAPTAAEAVADNGTAAENTAPFDAPRPIARDMIEAALRAQWRDITWARLVLAEAEHPVWEAAFLGRDGRMERRKCDSFRRHLVR